MYPGNGYAYFAPDYILFGTANFTYHGIWNSSWRVDACGNEIDFKDVDEKSLVCAQRLKSFQMMGAYQHAYV